MADNLAHDISSTGFQAAAAAVDPYDDALFDESFEVKPALSIVPSSSSADIALLGEALVDFIQCGIEEPSNPRFEGTALFTRTAGGAVANVAAALARLGVKNSFIGKVGDDPNGIFLLDQLENAGVDTTYVTIDDRYSTTVAFAEYVGPSKTSPSVAYSFARKPGADTMLEPEEVPDDVIRSAKVLHIGSLSLTNEPARQATMHAVDVARKAGTVVSLDVNLRPHSWDEVALMVPTVEAVLPLVDLLKMNVEEMEALCRTRIPEDGTINLLSLGPRLVVVTRGDEGAYVSTRKASTSVDAFKVDDIADTTGAGDAFWAAVLSWLLRETGLDGTGAIDRLDRDKLHACIRYGCAAASLEIEGPGAIPSMPSALEVADRLEEWNLRDAQGNGQTGEPGEGKAGG